MSTVHTEYGPGRIIAQETVRGRTRFKVAGEGFEVWLDQTKLGGYESPAEIDFNAPHWEGHNLDDGQVYPEPGAPMGEDEYAEYADPRGHLDRGRMRQHPDYLSDDDPDARFAKRRRQAGPGDDYAAQEMRGLGRGDYEGYDDEYDPRGEYGGLASDPGLAFDDDSDARYARRRQAGPEDDYAAAEMRGLGSGDYEGYGDEDDPGADYRGLAPDPGLAFDDDGDARYARRKKAFGPGEWDTLDQDDPYADSDYDDLGDLRRRLHPHEMDDDDPARYSNRRRSPGKGEAHLAWAPMDDDNSTALPYNPRPQHDAVSTSGDEESATIQPIHHIDADERLRSSDSISFDDADDGDEPGPNPDLFAKRGGLSRQAVPGRGLMQSVLPEQLYKYVDQAHQQTKKRVRDLVTEKTGDPDKGERAGNGVDGAWDGASAAGAFGGAEYAIERGMDEITPGYDTGWGHAIKSSSRREANPLLLALPAIGEALAGEGLGAAAAGMAGRAAGGMALRGLEHGAEEAMDATDPGEDWGGIMHDASYRPAGLSDKYIDLTASVDYHNDPAAQFRHDPDAYINRIGHVMDEGLNPRFAEYMDLVEGDSSVRTAAWKDVRQKAMRLKTSGAVHVKDIAPSRIMASVDGDHGTYDVVILKGASIGGLTGNSISNWHCGCEWGRWAFKRKFTFVGRLCSHAYASYLTMQSAALKGQERPRRRGPADTVIVNRPGRDRYLPTFQFAAGRRTADALQNGPERLVPELAINDTDDTQMFLDVTKDERKDTGPDDVMSDKDIVHFARLMRHCEVTERPYPRELVAFLSRYAREGDDVVTDFQADDADDANGALNKLRADADRDQESSFGSMADRVHRIQDAVEEARDNGADASRFVAMVRFADTVDGQAVSDNAAPPGYKAVPGGASGTQLYREVGDGKSIGEAWGAERGNKGIEVGPNGKRQVKFDGDGGAGQDGNKFNYDGGAYGGPNGKADPQAFADSFQGKPPAAKPASSAPTGSSDPDAYKTLNDKGQAVPKGQAPAPQPGQPNPAPGGQPNAAPGGQQTQTVNKTTGGDGAGDKGGAGGAAGTGKYTAPGGGQTSGTISDGGVAGAENGNNAAITKGGPNVDANGMYTVQQGDTWSDIAQRSTGDMNNYQKMYDLNKGVAGGNIDDLAAGTQVNLKDFLNDTGNNNVRGDVTNPAGGGVDKNPATADAGPSVQTGVGGLSTANGFAGNTPKVNTDAAADPASAAPAPPGGEATVNAVKPVETPKPADAAPAPAPKPTAGGDSTASLRTARDWLRWAAETEGSSATNETSDTTTQPTDASVSTSPSSGPGASPTSRSAPASNPAQTTVPGSPSLSETYDPASPAQVQQQSMNAANPGQQSSNTASDIGGMIGDVGGMIGGAVGNFLPGVGGAISGISGLAGGIANAVGSGMGRQSSAIFSSEQDFDDWVRYAYPTGAGDDDDPKSLPHIPFNGSGNPGKLEFSTSEEYADKARKKHDDVTDLGDHDVHTPMGDWQKQSAISNYSPEEDAAMDRAFRHDVEHPSPEENWDDWLGRDIAENPHNYTASASGGGRFDDISGAAAGFLRTAGRNYSLAEQSELIREGDKGGARNLDSLDLKGTHYEDMHTLGW